MQITTNAGKKVFSTEEISSMVLIKMKETTEVYLGKKVNHVVLSSFYDVNLL